MTSYTVSYKFYKANLIQYKKLCNFVDDMDQIIIVKFDSCHLQNYFFFLSNFHNKNELNEEHYKNCNINNPYNAWHGRHFYKFN